MTKDSTSTLHWILMGLIGGVMVYLYFYQTPGVLKDNPEAVEIKNKTKPSWMTKLQQCEKKHGDCVLVKLSRNHRNKTIALKKKYEKHGYTIDVPLNEFPGIPSNEPGKTEKFTLETVKGGSGRDREQKRQTHQQTMTEVLTPWDKK